MTSTTAGPGTALAGPQAGSHVSLVSLNYTAAQLAAIRAEYAKGANDAQFENFMRECVTRNLIPGKHVYFQLRKGREWDSKSKSYIYLEKPIHITSIDALRLIAQRTGEYQGQGPITWLYLYEDKDGFISNDIPLPQEGSTSIPRRPWAARATVFRKGFAQPIQVVARFDAYSQTYKDDGQQKLTLMWEARGPEQLAKCAEALALRQAFPEELGQLYLLEELREEVEEK